jgi:hypothetical protein
MMGVNITVENYFYMAKISDFINIGIQIRCYDYGRFCYRRYGISRVMWFFYIITLLNVIFELLNILLLLCKRTRSPINLILGKVKKKNV